MATKSSIENPIYKVAYRIQSWGDKIERGMAFTITYIDYYEVNKAFFIADGKKLPSIVDAKTIVFSKKEAVSLLADQKAEYRKYCQKQIDEYSNKLKKITA